jgi:hypothetical protein
LYKKVIRGKREIRGKPVFLRGEMKLSRPDDTLKGITLEAYKYVLKNGKPTRIRELQNSLSLSSPRLAFYHLNKLEEVGLVKKTPEGYVADRVILHDQVRFRRFLVPRDFFYALFFATMLIFQLTVFRPDPISKYYAFALIGISAAFAISIYETARVIKRKTI